MGCSENGLSCSETGFNRIDQYALVSYIPDPLGKFLDLLRLRLAPECRPHAHVTVLPPRQLRGPVESAETELQDVALHFHPFDVTLGSVEMFEVTKVIYLGVERGGRELHEMHRQFDTGTLHFEEPYTFHPHITLAQNLLPERVEETFRIARESWAQWKGMVTFPVEELSFVQNTDRGIWLDLQHIPLVGEPAGVRR